MAALPLAAGAPGRCREHPQEVAGGILNQRLGSIQTILMRTKTLSWAPPSFPTSRGRGTSEAKWPQAPRKKASGLCTGGFRLRLLQIISALICLYIVIYRFLFGVVWELGLRTECCAVRCYAMHTTALLIFALA